MNAPSGKKPGWPGWLSRLAAATGFPFLCGLEAAETEPARVAAPGPAPAGEVRSDSNDGPAEPPQPPPPVAGAGDAARGRVGAEAPEPVFSLPAIYGYAPAVFGRGGARTGRQRWMLSGAVSAGYDDNVLLTPTHGEAVPAVFRDVFVPGAGGSFELQRVLVSPAVPAPERQGSLVGQAGVGGNFQILGRRSLFAVDAGLTWTHYWDRPGTDPDDYNGRLAWSYAYRLTPRLQFSAQFNGAYLSQPDFTRINTPQAQAGGEYFTSNSKADLAYRWTPRISTVLSLSQNALRFADPLAQAGDYDEWILGGQIQYLLGPVWSVSLEGRHGVILYDAASDRDSTTEYLLAGSDFRLSQRLSATLRAGGAFRRFDQSGGQGSSPYGEGTLQYRVSPGSRIELRTRYGFEEPRAAGVQLLSWRTSGNYLQILSSRASLSAGMSYVRQVQTAGLLEETSQTLEGSLRLQYYLTRRFSVNTSYVHTAFDSEGRTQDYYRNRIFLGGEYEF